MKLFNIEEGIVKPTDYILGISPFNEVYKRDKTKHKDKAVKDFTFIEYFCSPKYDNPYKDLDKSDREKKILNDISLLKGYKPDKLVWQCVDKYEELLHEYSFSYRFLQSSMRAAQNVRDFLETVDLGERDDKGRPVYKPKEITSALKDVSDILKNLQELRKRVNDEIDSAKVYGDKQINPLEK